jgi:hypothetical protein
MAGFDWSDGGAWILRFPPVYTELVRFIGDSAPGGHGDRSELDAQTFPSDIPIL